jgi:transcriptional regulator of acetoin/glycerol metabolism
MREQRYRGTGAADEERAAIVSVLEATGGALAQSAELLGMGRTTLWRKLKQLGLTPTGADESEQDGGPT